ncbi:MAG: flagellar motor protein MotB [Sphingomonas sp.]|uniref:OmpA family protein n=1 Tax=Sphingomonas sp. TaxID=28214 RepID=UPI001ACC9A5C|nr:OmpA family protein [Sphingomonas sp.]MBN8808002.1 flagellar motor protein MotB [Sphingomonas sp.]
MTDPLDPPPARPLWLWTLADLALLLVGFFVLIQATDRRALAKGLREGFGGVVETPAPIPVASVVVASPPGSATLNDPAQLTSFAASALRDPRVSLRIVGSAAAAGDVDPATGSAALLASDRARAAAAYLIAHGTPAGRIAIAAPGTGRSGVLVTLSFTGDPAQEKQK